MITLASAKRFCVLFEPPEEDRSKKLILCKSPFSYTLKAWKNEEDHN